MAVIGDIGGVTIDDAVRRVMKFCMTNDVALQFNLFGRQGKKALNKTNLYTVIVSEYQIHYLLVIRWPTPIG